MVLHAYILYSLGDILNLQINLLYAINCVAYVYSGVTVANSLGSNYFIGNFLYLLGNITRFIDTSEGAINYYKSSLVYFEVNKEEYTTELSLIYTNLATIYSELDDLENAVMFYFKAFDCLFAKDYQQRNVHYLPKVFLDAYYKLTAK